MGQQYESHLTRIKDRPGEKLQVQLSRRFLDKLPISKSKEKNQNSCRVLEIGPGSGRVAELLLKSGFLYEAIEPTPIMRSNLISASRGYTNMGKVWPNQMPEFDPEQFSKYDYVLAFHVLEHMRDQYEAREFISSCFKMLKPNGHILIVSPDYRDYKNLFYEIDWSHGFPTSVERVRSLLVDIGFADIVSEGSRAGTTSHFFKACLFILDRILPLSILDLIFLKSSGHRLLASGFSVGFLKKNVIALARKP